jgi:hypothetical protein
MAEPTALSFYQLIGAPLYALIEAESYAADATAQFIERVGFEPASTEDASDKKREDLGKLRTISFRQEKRDASGAASSYKVEVPLLSVLPIPALQIREAELEFFVKIVDMLTEGQVGNQTQKGEGEKNKMGEPGAQEKLVRTPPRIDLKTMLGRGQPGAPVASKSAFDMQVRVKIKVEQADVPAGMARLFNLMEQSISSTPLTGTEEGS